MKRQWERFTDLFGETVFHPQFIILSLRRGAIEKIKKVSKNKELIDLGCGRMPYRKELEPGLKKYIGIDHPGISHLYYSTRRPDILADITKKIPVKNGSFDTAIMLEVLEYLETPLKTFDEVNRILKRNGFLILTSPFLYPLHDVPYDRNRFTNTQISDFLMKTGFK